MLVCKKILIFCAFACCGTLFAQNIQNPVLPGVADAGVMKYNGKYYIGGVILTGKSTSLSFRKKEPDTPLYLQVI